MKPHTRHPHTLSRKPLVQFERGITLIVAMILLLVISVMAAATVRGSASSELVANNARSQELAWQVTEAALRYCEVGVRNQHVQSLTTTIVLGTSDYTTTISAAPATGSNPLWMTTTSWDGSPSSAVSIPLYKLDDPAQTSSGTGITRESAKFEGIYKRAPDCIAQYAGTLAPASRVIWVTARGFGPEVSNASGSPDGAEIFLQSTLDFN